MIRVLLPPLAAGYLVFVAMVIIGVRRPVPRLDPARRERARRRALVVTTTGGYGAFLAIVLVFHVWIAGEREAFASALWGGGFLLIVALAVWTCGPWIRGRLVRHE